MEMSGKLSWRLVRRLCKFFSEQVQSQKVSFANKHDSIIDEGLKFLERKFFIQKGNEKLPAVEQANGRPKKD